MGLYILEMFGVSLFLTLVIEEIIAGLWGLCGKKYFWLIFLVNTVTNPLAVLSYWIYGIYGSGNSLWVQVVIEIGVVLTEAWIYRAFAKDDKWSIRRPIWLAFVSNAVSWGIGLCI